MMGENRPQGSPLPLIPWYESVARSLKETLGYQDFCSTTSLLFAEQK